MIICVSTSLHVNPGICLFSAPPHTPQVTLATATTNSITMKLKPHASDKEPISGYTVRYKPEYGDWETVQVPADDAKYTLQDLGCGLKYQIVVNAFNRSVLCSSYFKNSFGFFPYA